MSENEKSEMANIQQRKIVEKEKALELLVSKYNVMQQQIDVLRKDICQQRQDIGGLVATTDINLDEMISRLWGEIHDSLNDARTLPLCKTPNSWTIDRIRDAVNRCLAIIRDGESYAEVIVPLSGGDNIPVRSFSLRVSAICRRPYEEANIEQEIFLTGTLVLGCTSKYFCWMIA
ncbi:MAG: hypothetical protein JRI80_00180 [Deltaproteobacteria bacterium]|nr:hypothetical protein [Deltaproteobacteria bacterium]